MKKEQAFIERELRRFEQDLEKSRPKFFRKSCSKKSMASSDDENFWGTTSRLKVKFSKRDEFLKFILDAIVSFRKLFY